MHAYRRAFQSVKALARLFLASLQRHVMVHQDSSSTVQHACMDANEICGAPYQADAIVHVLQVRVHAGVAAPVALVPPVHPLHTYSHSHCQLLIWQGNQASSPA